MLLFHPIARHDRVVNTVSNARITEHTARPNTLTLRHSETWNTESMGSKQLQ